MQRIHQALHQKKSLIPFITAGFPNLEITVPLMHHMVKNGADLIELGIPFSDPMADGPVIQQANELAIKNGATLSYVLKQVQEFRKTNQTTPVVLMGYANPIEQMGQELFINECVKSQVDGVLVVDYHLQEIEHFAHALKAKEIAPIFLVAPTTSAERINKIAQIADCGYIYYVSMRGVTGKNNINNISNINTLNFMEIQEQINHLKNQTNIPIAVGFGVKDRETAKSLWEISDGVVIGSKIINLMLETNQFSNEYNQMHLENIGTFIQSILVD